MPAPVRRLLLCFLVAGLAFLAHAPLFGSGFLGGDLELLASAAGRDARGEASGAWLAGGEVRPIPAALLRAHAALHAGLSPLEPAVAAPYFALALVVLLVAAAGAGVTLRRVLVPWLGESAARAAGWACAGLVVAHPASVATVARPIALGDLVALALGTWCTAFFLRGRQQRRTRHLVLSALLAVAAGFASSAAWLLPFACAALELASAQRTRAFPRKVAAAATVAIAASLAVAIEALCAWTRGFSFRSGSPLANCADPGLFSRDVGFDAVLVLDALGVLFVPVSSPGAAGAYLACGAVLLLAAEPLLRAARAAPRLWGWLALSWIGAVGLALALARDLRVPPGGIEFGSALLPSALVVCAALATAATALGGSRRTIVPLSIAALLCILSDRTARIWSLASNEIRALRGDLERGLMTAGPSGLVHVLGAPPGPEATTWVGQRGPDEFGAPFDLDLVAGSWPPHSTPSARLVRTQPAALPYLARLPSGADARRRGLAVLFLGREGKPAFRLAAPAGEPRPFAWREDGRSELVELDPLALTMVRVTPRAGISTAEPPRMRWRATDATFENGSVEGAWIATEDGPQAIFDLGRSLEWLLGGTIRRVWFEGDLRKVVTAEVLPDIPIESLARGGAGLDVVVPEARRARAWTGDAHWVALAIDPHRVCELEGRPEADDRIHFAVQDSSCLTAAGRIVECRVGDVTVARSLLVDER